MSTLHNPLHSHPDRLGLEKFEKWLIGYPVVV